MAKQKEVLMFYVGHADYYFPEVKEALDKILKKGMKVALERFGLFEGRFADLPSYCKKKGGNPVILPQEILDAIPDLEAEDARWKLVEARDALYYKKNKKKINGKLESKKGLTLGQLAKLQLIKENYAKLCKQRNKKDLAIEEIQEIIDKRVSKTREKKIEQNKYLFKKREKDWLEVIKKEKPDIILVGEAHSSYLETKLLQMGLKPVLAYSFLKKPLPKYLRKQMRRSHYYDYEKKQWKRPVGRPAGLLKKKPI